VAFHVEREVVATREGTLAQFTLKGSNSRVLPKVSGELITARKLPSAAFPRAMIRLFASVRSHVGLQVGALRVCLAAVLVRALVYTRCLLLAHNWHWLHLVYWQVQQFGLHFGPLFGPGSLGRATQARCQFDVTTVH
jgi:hypothetical protein